jgi:hypothetical protein
MNPRTPQPEGRDPLSAILGRWMADGAPHAVPDRTLDAIAAATTRVPQRGRRGTWPAVLASAAAAAVVAAIAVVAFGFLGREQVGEVVPSTTASPTATQAPSPTDRSLRTPTAEAQTPAPDPNESLVRFVQGCDVTPPVSSPSATVMRDGRVVWDSSGPDPAPDGLAVRLLSPEGLDAMRSMIEETGLFGADGDYPFVRRSDAPDPPGRGYCVYTFMYAPPDREPVTVTSAMWFGDEFEATYFEPSPERKALDDLAQLLRDPETGLSADSWAEHERRPYDADEFLVVAGLFTPQITEPGAPDIDAVTWPFPAAPDAFGEPAGHDEGASPQRCDVATRDAIAPLFEQLAAAGYEQFVTPRAMAMATLPWSSRSAGVELIVVPLMPDGSPGCDEVN